MPVIAVSFLPTTAEPETVGTGATNDPATTTAVALLVFATDLYPALDPVTRTDIDLPRSAEPNVSVDAVALEIATPERSH